MANGIRVLFGALLLGCCLATLAEGRQWTDRQGRMIEAQYIRLDGETVVLQQGLKPLRVPLDNLSDDDQEYVRKRAGIQAPAKPADDGTNVKPGNDVALTADRLWTDNQGRTVNGRFERMLGTSTVILRINGTPTPLPFDRLSAADQQFLRDQGALPAGGNIAGGGVIPAIPGLPGGLVPPIRPSPISRSKIVPIFYPNVSASQASLDAPRWWHTPNSIRFACIRRIGWGQVQLAQEGTVITGHANFSELPPSEFAYVLDLLQKAGQTDFIEKIRSTNPALFAGAPVSTQAAEAGLSNGDATTSAPREWFDDFESFDGQLIEVGAGSIKVQETNGRLRTLFSNRLFEGDLAYVLNFLEQHKATAILDTFRQQIVALERDRPGQLARVDGEMRGWQVRGQSIQAKVEWFGRQGFELRDDAGKVTRVTYKELNPADAQYLATFVAGKDELRSVASALAAEQSGANPLAGLPRSPGFVPPLPPRATSNPGSFPPPPGSSFPAPPRPPAFVPPPTPSIPQFSPPGLPNDSEADGYCSNCNREVPAHIGAGDRCPHCGVTFDYVENADGSKTYSTGHIVSGVIFGALCIVGILARFGAFSR